MALVVKDRVKETTTTTGTGTITLAGAVGGFQTFSAIGNGNVTYYCIAEKTGTAWEVGYGTYTASGTTLSRTVVLESSNAGSLVDFGAGIKEVFCTYPAERAVYLDSAGSAVTTLDIGTLGTSTANITTANITAGTISTTPSSANDITNKTYVDTLVASGIHFHQPVRVESPINLNATYNNGTAGVGATLTNAGTQVALEIDGVTVSVADRVLVYQQTTQTQNGIYVVTDVGSGATNWILTRSTDANTYVINSANGLSEGSTVFVQQGATGAGETYTCNTSGVITFGTTNITFAQISSAQIYSAGTGLTLAGTQFSITNTGTAGTYGSASSVPVFVTNAQGQVTSVTPTAIAITGAAVSGDIAGNAGSATVLATARNINGVSFNGSANIDVNTNNAVTFNNSGTGAASGSTFNGGSLLTVSYNTIGAPSTTGTNASGNWNINVTGSAASATTATTATNQSGGTVSATTGAFSGVATFSAGSAASPAIAAASDTNTGMFFPAADTIAFAEGGVEAMRLDSAGNMGLGVTPSPWDTLRGFDIGSGGAVWGTAAQVGLASNNYYGSGGFRYKATNVAAALQVDGNIFKFFIAPSGTAGNTISFTQAMTLHASGGLSVGTTTDPGTGLIADVAGNLRAIPPAGAAKTGSYTLVKADVGDYVEIGSGGSITVPTSIFAAGDAVAMFNNTTGNITITCSAPTAYVGGTNTVRTSVTLATRGVCNVLFISPTLCVITGNVT
jgi:hypothetical protein